MKNTFMLQLVSFLAGGSLCLAAVATRSVTPLASNTYGVGGPPQFNDADDYMIPTNATLTSLTLRGMERLDAISFSLSSGQTFSHGGRGGKPSVLPITEGDRVICVKVCWQDDGKAGIHFAEAKTVKGVSISAGQTTQNCATVTAPEKHGIVGSFGRAGKEIEQIGFIYRPYNESSVAL